MRHCPRRRFVRNQLLAIIEALVRGRPMPKTTKKARKTAKVRDLKAKKNPKGGRKAGKDQQDY